MRKLRSFITSKMPKNLVAPGRRLARGVDQIIGLPFSPFRRGSVAMFHVGRCGSTMLGNLLDQHSAVFWDGEIYYTKWLNNQFKFKAFDSRRYLEKQMLVSRTRYYGFEIKPLEDQHLAIIKMNIEEYIHQLNYPRHSRGLSFC